MAARLGSQAVMVHQPIHPYQSAEGWVEYHAAIAEGLPDLGVVPYVRDPSVTPACSPAWPGPRQRGRGEVRRAQPDAVRRHGGGAVGAQRLAWVCGLAEGWAPFFWPGGAVGFTSGLVNVETGALLGCCGPCRRGTTPPPWRSGAG